MSQLTYLGRVLIVDDEVELMRALCDSLSDEGFKVKGSSDPHSALDELRRNEYDLILTDLMMPAWTAFNYSAKR
jgi:two-component system response regulator AtoC